MGITLSDTALTVSILFVLIGLFFSAFYFHLLIFRRKGRFSPFTEDFFRLPGHSVRLTHSEYKDDLLLLYMFFCLSEVAMVLIALFVGGVQGLISVIMAVGVLVYCVVKLNALYANLQATRLGYEGEEYTGQELNLLMLRGAYVFHDIPYKYGNIDHIVIGHDKVFAVETKAIRKPAIAGTRESKEAKVRFDGTVLKFPHFQTKKPVEQARMHAKYLSEVIEKKCGFSYPVYPVIALPGWHITVKTKSSDPTTHPVLVINPKRGKALLSWLGQKQNKDNRKRVINYIASVSRSISPKSKTTDPNADKYYDSWINPRYTEAVLGDEV